MTQVWTDDVILSIREATFIKTVIQSCSSVNRNHAIDILQREIDRVTQVVTSEDRAMCLRGQHHHKGWDSD